MTVATFPSDLADDIAEAADSIRANLTRLAGWYDTLAPRISSAATPHLGALTADELKLVVTACIAFRCGTYGSGGAADLGVLLKRDTHSCSSYGLLGLYLAQEIGVDFAVARPKFVGWQGPGMGNHQIVLMGGLADAGLMLDPTAGLFCRANFDAIAKGTPIPTAGMVRVREFEDAGMAFFQNKVIKALRDGLLTPGQLMYYFDGIDHYRNNFGSPTTWPTPGAMTWRGLQV